MYCSLILRDFAFIEHYFFDKIAILTKLSATIWLKLLETASYFDSSSFRKIVGTEIPVQCERQNNNPEGRELLLCGEDKVPPSSNVNVSAQKVFWEVVFVK